MFSDFCNSFNQKIRWDMSEADWTEMILSYFGDKANSESAEPINDYMSVDQVWRGRYQELVFALEHEHGTDVNELLTHEVAHLVDLRAKQKVGIFYPNLGDENALIEAIKTKLASVGLFLPLQEEYMFILGFSTRKQGRPAIKFKAYILDKVGKQIDLKEAEIFQAVKSPAT